MHGVSDEYPSWLQHVSGETKLEDNCGTTINVLCFNEAKNWETLLAASVAENFFGAIATGRLKVIINKLLTLEASSIRESFTRADIRRVLQWLKD